jgi:PAS domain S-box-containing protein
MTAQRNELEHLRGLAAQECAARQEAESLAESAIGRFYEEQKHLILLQSITVAANEAHTFADAMTIALEKLCRHNDWSFGHVFTGEESAEGEAQLIAAQLWHAERPGELEVFRNLTAAMRLTRDASLAGYVFANGQPAWTLRLGADANETHAVLAKKLGLRSAYVFPLFAGTQVVGVMEFFTRSIEEPSNRFLELMAHVGTQLGRVLERDRQAVHVRKSEAYFRRLTDNSLDLITILEPDGTIRYESHSIETMLGYKPEEYRGKNAFDFLHPEDVAHVAEAFQTALRSQGNTPQLTFRFRHRDGSYRILEGCGNNLLNDPVVAGVIFNSRDVTERKKLEEQFQQSQKVQAIGQLAGGVAHDFNNILTAILGYSDVTLRQLSPNHVLHQNISEIRRAAERAASLTRQLLAFSRKQVLQPRVLDLNIVVGDMDKMLRRLLGEHIDLVTLLPEAVGRIKADPGQVEQIIMNLAVNARDAMPKGGKLTIETKNITLDQEYSRYRTDVAPGDYVMLAVSDNGIGMTAEVKARVFEPFFTTKKTGEGTGLGLATCHGIVKQSGGHISVYSEQGHGTTFKVLLPRVEAPVDGPEFAEPAPEEMQHGTETVLLVEDEPMLRELGCMVLGELGYRVLNASNGVDALRVLDEHPDESIDLLVTDVVMPEMGGPELANQMRSRSPRTKVLFCSGYTEDAITRDGKLQRGTSFMQKPYSVATLASRVREVLA